jgi:methylphosphotriester-DNA--protein-cysteine methyltransferase
MNITFQKKNGDSSLGIAFFGRMEIETRSPTVITDHFIPELFLDSFFIKKGKIQCVDKTRGTQFALPPQALKTIHTRPLRFVFSTPLVLFGARFSLKIAESFWQAMRANSFLEQTWGSTNAKDLEAFAARVTEYVEKHRTKKWPYPMLLPALEESGWLINFSPRHKRRLYKATFGLSRKALQNIHNLHSFLEQTCDFASQNPRIIQHVNPEVFYDQPHLNHTFKKMTGFSPVEYFQASSILQDNLMSASYNEFPAEEGKL